MPLNEAQRRLIELNFVKMNCQDRPVVEDRGKLLKGIMSGMVALCLLGVLIWAAILVGSWLL